MHLPVRVRADVALALESNARLRGLTLSALVDALVAGWIGLSPGTREAVAYRHSLCSGDSSGDGWQEVDLSPVAIKLLKQTKTGKWSRPQVAAALLTWLSNN